jgi:hypothetical protein
MISGRGDDGSDVLVIRVWHEADADQPFRARITYGGDQQRTTGDPEAVLALVRQWLAEHVGAQDPPAHVE